MAKSEPTPSVEELIDALRTKIAVAQTSDERRLDALNEADDLLEQIHALLFAPLGALGGDR